MDTVGEKTEIFRRAMESPKGPPPKFLELKIQYLKTKIP